MSQSIAILGAGPGLGQAVARRYAHSGYDVVLVARRPDQLQRLAAELSELGGSVHVVPADLSDPAGIPAVAEQIRTRVGELHTLYYGPTAGGGRPARTLTPSEVQAYMPLAVYSLVALVNEFLPAMIERREGAILLAAGASAVRGMAHFSGPGPALAAQRNYLESLQGELVDSGVYVGRLYVGAPIAGSAWHATIEAEKAAGRTAPGQRSAVDPAQLADLLWMMHHTTRQAETVYPAGIVEP
jgi:short-subunit dehydrogenase